MIETQSISFHMSFLSNNRYIHTFESNKSMKLGNKYFYFIINSFILSICHFSSLFVTTRHYSSLFVSIRHHSSLFVTICQYPHYSSLFSLFGHYPSLFATICTIQVILQVQQCFCLVKG